MEKERIIRKQVIEKDKMEIETERLAFMEQEIETSSNVAAKVKIPMFHDDKDKFDSYVYINRFEQCQS